MVSHMLTKRSPINGIPANHAGASGKPSSCTSLAKVVASRTWSARLNPSHTSGPATSSIQPNVRMPAANDSRPLRARVSKRIKGQLANASTAPQNKADQNGAITHRLAPNNTRSRICTSRRSLLSMCIPHKIQREIRDDGYPKCSRGSCLTSAATRYASHWLDCCPVPYERPVHLC